MMATFAFAYIVLFLTCFLGGLDGAAEVAAPARLAAIKAASTRIWNPCPEWIEEYGQLHKKTLEDHATKARYVLFTCEESTALYW